MKSYLIVRGENLHTIGEYGVLADNPGLVGVAVTMEDGDKVSETYVWDKGVVDGKVMPIFEETQDRGLAAYLVGLGYQEVTDMDLATAALIVKAGDYVPQMGVLRYLSGDSDMAILSSVDGYVDLAFEGLTIGEEEEEE